MTVGRLLAEADSLELTTWQAFFIEDAKRQQDALEARRAERRILGDE